MMLDTQVIIIGAGPAGLSAARVLAAHDIDYMLLAREHEPCSDKVCGGFIPARAIADFNLGLIKKGYRIKSIRMKFPGMSVERVDFDKTVGINTTRAALGKLMLHSIPNYSDNINMATNVTGLIERTESIEVHTQSNEEKQVLSSLLVIDASGVNSVSIRSGLVRNRLPNIQMGYGLQYHFEIKNGDRSFEPVNDFYYGAEYSPGGYAWLFPQEHTAVAGTGGIVHLIKSEGLLVNEFLNHFVLNTKEIQEILADTEVIGQDAALMPLAGIVRPSFSDRILLAGDAAGHCSPISGEGIHYSMIGGKLAADMALKALSEKQVNKKSLSRYERRWINEIGADLKWGAWLQKRFTRGGSSKLGSTFLDSEKSQRVIAEMLVGERSVRSAIIKAAPGYLKSKLGL
ncbi:MAG: NAD(P)/FAD-dependent oxidoreductase [Candidatus Thorarchaeota archaeon]